MDVLPKRLALPSIAGRQMVDFNMDSNRQRRQRGIAIAALVTLLVFSTNFSSIAAQVTVLNTPAGSEETTNGGVRATSGDAGLPPQTTTTFMEFKDAQTEVVQTTSSSMSSAAGTTSESRDVVTTRRQTSQQTTVSTAGLGEQTTATTMTSDIKQTENKTVKTEPPVSTESDPTTVTMSTGVDTQNTSAAVTSSSESPLLAHQTTTSAPVTTTDSCSPAPCQNGGTCSPGAGPTGYGCTCTKGWTGANCTDDVDECTSQPCQNGGTCLDGVGNFSCLCPRSHSGDTCQMDIDECMSNPCQNGAACVDGVDGFRCNCTSFWTGVYCTEDVDECRDESSNPCDDMALCENLIGNVTCTCKPGYTGTGIQCEFIDMCLTEPPPCGNGHCFSKMYGYECKCKTGWTGANCTEDIDECVEIGSARCDTGETITKLCVNMPGDFSCVCPPGMHPNRQDECVGDVLYHHGNVTGYQSDDDIYGPFLIPGGFPFYGKQYYSIYASMNGYIIFEKKYLTPQPPGGSETQFPESTAIIAPLWADTDSSVGQGAMYVDIATPQSRNSSRVEEVTKDLEEYVGRQDLNITVAMVITWKDVALYPASIYSGVQNATFQLVLATTNEESFAMFNYNPDGDWWDFDDGVDVRKVLIGLTDGGSNSVRLADVNHYPANESNVGLYGRYVFTLGARIENSGLECLSWSRSQDMEMLTQAWIDSVPCPCTWTQAIQDTRFTLNTATWCAETRLTMTGTHQRCCYDRILSLLTGYPSGGHLVLQADPAEVKDVCCNERVRLCELYYQARPSDNCSRYVVPVWGSMWGVGHVRSLNSSSFTVNTLNELLLLHLPDSQFLVQGRMGRVSTLDGSTRNATGLVAIAAKSNSSYSVELRITDDGDDVRIHVGGVDAGTMATMVVGGSRMWAGVAMERVDHDTLIVQFVEGVGLKVSRRYKFLQLLVTMAAPLAADRGRSGLLTHVTDTEGEVVMATAYLLQRNTSLFTYSVDGKTFTDFQMTDYMPENLIEEARALIGQTENQSEAVRSCDSIMECLYDYLAAGDDINTGIAAITADVMVKTNRRKLENFPPRFTEAVPRVVSVRVDNMTRVRLTAIDPEGDEVIYNISTNIPTSDYQLENGLFTWTPPLAYTSGNASVFITFTATDRQGAAASLRPEIRLCTCAGSDECDFSYRQVAGPQTNPDRFYESVCLCRPGYYGRLCLEWDNLCQQKPCYANDVTSGNCTFTDTSPLGFTCTPCPEGLVGDGIKCYDDNECVTGTNTCSDICYNQPGSYTCGCKRGFELSPDGATCRDLDECTQGQHRCDQMGQYCQNTPGFYKCACMARYFMDDEQCRQAGKRFGGKLRMKSVKLDDEVYIGWDENLKDPESELFNQVAARVENQVDFIYQGTPGFLSSAVTKFSEGSIDADFDLYFNASSPVDGTTVADVFARYLRSSQCQVNGPDCSLADLMGVSPEASSTFAKDLCANQMDNDCHSMSTNCTSYMNGTFDCQCKTGYSAWLNSRTICQDIDECSHGYDTCDVTTSQCVNTPGSYHCQCMAGYRKVGSICTAVCRPNPCLNDGQCIPAVGTVNGYSCRCRKLWVGTNCEDRNRDANKFRNILIGVGVGLGVLCLILFILLIVACIRIISRQSADGRTGKDQMDDKIGHAKRTYSTSSEVGLDTWDANSHIMPGGNHLGRTQFEMVENGSKQNLLDGKYKFQGEDRPPSYDGNGATQLGTENPAYSGASSEQPQNKLDTQYF